MEFVINDKALTIPEDKTLVVIRTSVVNNLSATFKKAHTLPTMGYYRANLDGQKLVCMLQPERWLDEWCQENLYNDIVMEALDEEVVAVFVVCSQQAMEAIMAYGDTGDPNEDERFKAKVMTYEL